MIAPDSRASMPGSTARASSSGAVTLTSISSRDLAAGSSVNGM